MLTKKEFKACLQGEYTKVLPAYFFWFDKDFETNNKDFSDDMKSKYQDDFIQTYPLWNKRATDPLDLTLGEYTDEFGCRFCESPNGVGAHPTAPIIHSVEEWIKYKEDYMPTIIDGVFEKGAAETVRKNPDSYITMNIWRTFYERMYMLMGMIELWMAIAMKDELFLLMLDDLKELTKSAIKLAAKAGVDAVYLADDWGMQDRLQISPQQFKQYFKPAYAEMIELAHSLGLDVWMHSCGCIDSIIPDFIDIKLDVIGNLQTSAVNLKKLSENYLGQITFFGGLDVQSNLTTGTQQSVADEVVKLAELFKTRNG